MVGPYEHGASYGVDDPAVDESTFLGGGEGRASDTAGAARGRGGHAAAHVAPELVGGELEVTGSIHPDEVGVEVEHERRFGLAGVLCAFLSLEQVVDGHVPYVDDTDAGVRSDEAREGFHVGIVAVTGDDDELGNAVTLPAVEELVEAAVQRLAAEGGSTCVRAFGAYIDAEAERRGSQHPELL